MNNVSPAEQEILQRLDRIERSIHGIQETGSNTRPLTLQEAAAYLGLSRSHLYKLTSQGKIPHYKPQGKKVYFERKELDQWLLRNPVKTKEQVKKQAAQIMEGISGVSHPRSQGKASWLGGKR